MCIPQFSNQAASTLCTTAYAAYSAVCAATAFVISLLCAIIQKVRAATAPFFSQANKGENGSVGVTPFAENTRIIYVNGVGNTLQTCRETAQTISRVFNDSRVDYTYIPLRVDEVARSILFGHRPASCDLLVANIRQQLHDLSESRKNLTNRSITSLAENGDPQQSKLLIFVHSGGGAMLEAVRNELSEEERSQISVYSFGSAHQFGPQEGFRSVTNAVAGGDPVPSLCRLLDRKLEPQTESWNIGGPSSLNIRNHLILNDPYQLAIEHIRVNDV